MAIINNNIISSRSQNDLHGYLAKGGISTDGLDKLLVSQTLEKIIAQNPEIGKYIEAYLRMAQGQLHQLTSRDYEAQLRARPASIDMPGPEYFKSYMQEMALPEGAMPKGFFDHPETFAKEYGLNAEEVNAINMIFGGPVQASSGNYSKQMTDGGHSKQQHEESYQGKSYTQDLRAQTAETGSNVGVEGWFNTMFDNEDTTRGLMADMTRQLMGIRETKTALMAELGSIDPSTPEGRKRYAELQAKLEEHRTGENELMEYLSSLQRMRSELMQFISNMIDTQFKTLENIVSKIGR